MLPPQLRLQWIIFLCSVVYRPTVLAQDHEWQTSLSPDVRAARCPRIDAGCGALLINTTSGIIRGTQDSHGVRSWLGIPFAAAPTGLSRFELAEPFKYATKIIDGSKFGSSCLQNEVVVARFRKLLPFNEVVEDEDCLSLNIWASSRNVTSTRKSAVLVWVGAHLLSDRV